MWHTFLHLRHWPTPVLTLLLALGAGLPWRALAQTPAPVPVPGLPYWEWQAPRPTGFGLSDIHVFDDQAAFAVGEHGTALKTTNQGRTWLPVNVGTANDLKAVSFASPLVGWVAYNTPNTSNASSGLFGPGQVRKTTDGGLTWAVQPIGEADFVVMQSIRFFSATNGYVAYRYNGPGTLNEYRMRFTTDGGQTWTLRQWPPGFTAVNVQFVTPQVGYVLGSGGVLKTTDGGLTFTDVTPNPTIGYDQVWFVNAQVGYVAGGPDGTTPNMYRTTNGGATWTPLGQFGIGTPPYYQFYNLNRTLNFADPLHGTLYGWITADGGQTWRLPTATGVQFDGVTRLRPSGVGFSVGMGGLLRTTTDFGLTTRRLTDSTAVYQFTKIRFADPVRGWATAVDNRRVARTTDRGSTWQTLDMAATAPGVDWRYAQQLKGAFPDADTAFVLGMSSAPTPPYALDYFIVKTTDGGQSWTRLPYAGTTEMYDIQFRDTRHGLLVGTGGQTWRTQDGGQTWTAGQPGTAQHLRVVSWADARTAYAVGDSVAFVRTTDAGLTWQRVNTSFFTAMFPFVPGGQLVNVCFTGPRTGFYVSYRGIFRTVDGGQTWAATTLSQSPNFNGGLQAVSFVTPRKGLAFGSQTYQTSDGGLTWSPLANMGSVEALAGSPVDRYNAWTAGRNGSILHYSEKFITAAPLAQTTHCAGGGLALAFATTGTFPAAEQRFKVELSNVRGRFRPGQIRVVGQGTASPLAVALPLDLPAGSRYRLRVVQADSLVLGADTGQDLTINAAPLATLTPAGPQTLCAGRTLTLTAPAGQAQYLWSTGATTRTLAVSADGSYTVRVAGASGCFGPPSAAATVTTAPVPATPVIQRSAGGQLSVTPLAGATYQWSNGPAPGRPIAGATAASYPATGTAPVGTYTVVVTSAAGCASAPSAGFVVILATRGALPAGGALYPNPADERLTVELAPGGGLVQLTLLDALGRTVLARTTAQARTVLDVAALPAGTYWLRAVYPDGTAGTQPVQVRH